MTAPQTAVRGTEGEAGPRTATYLMVWPVLDGDRTLRALIAEGEPLLWDALVEQGLRPASETDWQLCDDWSLPGAVDGLALTARVEVEPVTLTLEPSAFQVTRLERIAEVDRLTTLGLSATQVAGRLGITKRTVERDRTERYRLTS